MTDIDFFAPIRALSDEYDLLPKGGHLLLALSGGRDSMALLHALLELRTPYGFRLSAAHLNHKLRGADAARDADFVQSHCAALQIPCYVGEADVREQASALGLGLEACARTLRYAFLENTAKVCGANRIATAHHADDNLETLLLHLTRGAGLRGLRGMQARRGAIVRPLLTLPRADIEDFVARHEIPFVEDASNADTTFARNRLRHEVIPVLRSLNPRLCEHTTSAMRSLQEDEAYLRAQATALARCARPAEDGLVLERSVLNRAPRALAVRVLQQLLAQIESAPVAQVHLNAILAIATGANPSAAVHLPDGVIAHRVYTDLLLAWDHRSEPLPPLPPCPLPREGTCTFGRFQIVCTSVLCPASAPYSKNQFYLKAPPDEAVLFLRARREGDELALPARRNKSLKRLMIDEKIPRRERERFPVLCADSCTLAVIGLGAQRDALATAGEPALALSITTL